MPNFQTAVRTDRLAKKIAFTCCLAMGVTVGLTSCAGDPPEDQDPCAGTSRCVAEGEYPFANLSDYDLFVRDDPGALDPKDGVVVFEPAAPLWSDGARKFRHIILPENTQIGFDEGEDWVWPEGTIIAKTFAFDHDLRDPGAGYRIIETRLLIFEQGEWKPHVYLWNDEQTDAVLHKVGERVDVAYTDKSGVEVSQQYIVPNLDKCGSCHERDDALQVLGPFTQQLNIQVERDGQTVDQLTWLSDQGLFDTTPNPSVLAALARPESQDPLADRARAYLHANCAHCHRPGGGANRSGISFLAWEQDPYEYGVCKPPAAAGAGAGGNDYDITPGFPDQSIVVFRMNSTVPDIKMPELPNLVVDTFGVELISEWIASMPPEPCG